MVCSWSESFPAKATTSTSRCESHGLLGRSTVVLYIGRRRSVRTADSIDLVDELVLSREDKPQSRGTVGEISRETGIHRSSVTRIIHKDLRLKCFKKRRAQELSDANCKDRLQRSRLLLQKFPEHAVDFVFFSDEKLFTVASLVNSQNDRVYAPSNAKKHGVAHDHACCVVDQRSHRR